MRIGTITGLFDQKSDCRISSVAGLSYEKIIGVEIIGVGVKCRGNRKLATVLVDLNRTHLFKIFQSSRVTYRYCSNETFRGCITS